LSKKVTFFVTIQPQIHTDLSASGGLTQKYKEITDIILDEFVKSLNLSFWPQHIVLLVFIMPNILWQQIDFPTFYEQC